MKKYKKEEEKVECDTPKLKMEHLHEITVLLRLHKTFNKLLHFWGAVSLDENGNITAIRNYHETSEFSWNKYEVFEPLKGIKYTGQGAVCYTPYNWCTDWLEKWTQWIRIRAEEGDKEAVALCSTHIAKKKERESGLKTLTF